MRSILLSLSFVFAVNSLLAQSELHITTTNNIPIQLSLDKRYFKKHNTSLTVGNLPTGKHSIQVFAYRGDSKNKSFTDIIFEGTIKTNNGEIASCVIDPEKATMTVYRKKINSTSEEPHTAIDDPYIASPAIVATDTTPLVPAQGISPISKNEVTAIRKDASDKVTDTDKLKRLKSKLNGKAVSTDQVLELSRSLNFEKTRLEFVEWIYPNVVDKDQYGKLADSFTFNSSKKSLQEFLKSKNNVL